MKSDETQILLNAFAREVAEFEALRDALPDHSHLRSLCDLSMQRMEAWYHLLGAEELPAQSPDRLRRRA